MRAERLALGVAGLALASPATRWVADRLADQQSLCPLLRLTGVPCPSCGGTRAAVHLLGGEPLAALSLNPGATLFMCGVAVLVAVGVLQLSDLLGEAHAEPVRTAGHVGTLTG